MGARKSRAGDSRGSGHWIHCWVATLMFGATREPRPQGSFYRHDRQTGWGRRRVAHSLLRREQGSARAA